MNLKFAFVIGAILVIINLLLVPYVPFQDLPNHQLVFDLDRAMSSGETFAFVERPHALTLGYSLPNWIQRGIAPICSVAVAVRCMVILSAVGLPLATVLLARSLQLSWPAAWGAGLLAMPAGLGWPMAMGLLPYVVALPLVLTALALGIPLARRPSVVRMLALSAVLLLAYLAHPVAAVYGLMFLGLAGVFIGHFRLARLIPIALAVVPVLLAFTVDWHQQAFKEVPGVHPSFEHERFQFRGFGFALAQLFTRGYAITGPDILLAYVPLLLLVALTVPLASFRLWRSEVPEHAFLVLAAAAAILLPFAIPEQIGSIYLLASRLVILGTVFAAILAAAYVVDIRPMGDWVDDPLSKAVPPNSGIPSSIPGRAQGFGGRAAAVLALAGATGFALIATLGQIHQRADEIAQFIGSAPPRIADGTVLVVRCNDGSSTSGEAWGDADPVRHTWAYLIDRRAGSPYLFAFSRYHAVWFRQDAYARHFAQAPFECDTIERLRSRDAEDWRTNNAFRVRRALDAGMDHVLVMGRGCTVAWSLADQDPPGCLAHPIRANICEVQRLPDTLAGRERTSSQ